MGPSDHLFRREAGRMVATLTRVFGVHNLALAEDVVQDAFCRALEVWKFRGVPENPSAWSWPPQRTALSTSCGASAPRALLHRSWGSCSIANGLSPPSSRSFLEQTRSKTISFG